MEARMSPPYDEVSPYHNLMALSSSSSSPCSSDEGEGRDVAEGTGGTLGLESSWLTPQRVPRSRCKQTASPSQAQHDEVRLVLTCVYVLFRRCKRAGTDRLLLISYARMFVDATGKGGLKECLIQGRIESRRADALYAVFLSQAKAAFLPPGALDCTSAFQAGLKRLSLHKCGSSRREASWLAQVQIEQAL
eukprot:scaffold57552_cov17-Tisochrysis_lutea.AAC.1